jgi:uncharacterized protein
MEIQHKEGPESGKFFIEQNGARVAALVYYKEEDTITLEHTEVDKSLRGKKIGYKLVYRSVEYARQQRWKVVPVCPFAKVLFERNPEWKDVMV